MKRINNRPIAVEAVLTRNGTIVGPFMTELTGHPELTPYRGGWCGNEMFPDVLDDDLRRRAADLVRRLGDRLGQEGYRGFFEVDVLVDIDDRRVLSGRAEPADQRRVGDHQRDRRCLRRRAAVRLPPAGVLRRRLRSRHRRDQRALARPGRGRPVESHGDQGDLAGGGADHQSAPTGQYVIDRSGSLVFRRAALDWHQLQNEQEAFFLRIYGAGDYRWKGADLGVFVTKGRLQHSSETARSR